MSGTPSRAVLQRTVRHPLPVRLAAEARAVVISARARLVAVATRARRSRLLAGRRPPGLVPCPPFGRCLLAPGRAAGLLAALVGGGLLARAGEFTSRDRATFGGNFTSRWTWCRAVHTGCRYLVTKTKWPCNTDTPRLSVECPLLSHKT